MNQLLQYIPEWIFLTYRDYIFDLRLSNELTLHLEQHKNSGNGFKLGGLGSG